MIQAMPDLRFFVALSCIALAAWCVFCAVAVVHGWLIRTCAKRRLFSPAGVVLAAFALALLPTVAKRGAPSARADVPPAREHASLPSPFLRGNGSPAASASRFWLSQIGLSSNSVALGVTWDAGAFAAPPFVEFSVSTNLADDAWSLLGWAEAEAGETNLCVDIEAARLPGGAMPPAAFFRATAYDGLGGDGDDDDGDGIPNGWETAQGTNPLRADTDGDGIPDGDEAAWASVGEPFPDLDISSLANVLAGTQPYSTFPPSVAVSLPFAVEMAGHVSTGVIVHVNGVAAFPEAGGPANVSAFAGYGSPASLYATVQGAVAAYGFSFLPMGYAGSQLRAGIVQGTQGRWFVAEWRGMQDPMGFANLTFGSATFRLAVSETDPGTFRVQYVDVESMDTTQAILGAHGFGGEPSLSPPESISDGTTVAYRFGSGTDPSNPDTDGDGLPDGWEAAHGMDPLASNADDPRTDASADPDLDGLANAQEAALGTDPFQPDTDGDGMDDGWEARHGFDPATHNDDTARTDDDADADPDGDGLTNADECAWGTDPIRADTDGDGMADGAEIAQNGDPADATDDGKPNSRTPVLLYFGDHSTSHSEKYRLTVVPVAGSGTVTPPRAFSWVNANYGECETRTAMLSPGCSYEVRLAHASTNRPQGPDYDYTLNAVDVPQSVTVSDPDGLLGVHSSSDTFTGAGRMAVVTAYKVEVAVCSPDDDDWPELDASRVVLDDEELRIKVTVSPQMSSLAAVRQKFGDSLTVKTSGTCPSGAYVPIDDDAMFVNSSGKSEIRMSKTRQQLISLGLLPSSNDDGVNEMAVYDVGTLTGNDGSDLSDSNAFIELGVGERGIATGDPSLTLESTPPRARLSESFLKAAGCEIITVSCAGVESGRWQIMNQADILYYSGHGLHKFALLNDYGPSVFSGLWNRDLDCLIVSGCSILDINDYNDNFTLDPEDHVASPGKLWEAVGPNVMLGYNYLAPSDAGGAPSRIVRSWVSSRGDLGDVAAWMNANRANNAWNACAIVKGQKYVYFEKFFYKKFRRVKEVPKGDW